MTKLGKTVRPELQIGATQYTLTLSSGGLKLAEKGRRKGVELRWKDLVNGDAAIATALRASLTF